MNNQTFTPQFPVATLQPTYVKIFVKGAKAYVPVISINGRTSRPTHKKTKTAVGALAYSKAMIERYRRMVDTAVLAM